MWIFLADSFLSIVQKPGDTDVLTVRARIAGDIEKVFPGAEVAAGEGTDYRFRARIPRAEVAAALAARVESLSAANFKASVRDPARHAAYMEVWDAMYRYQARTE